MIAEKVTAADVRAAIKARWPDPEYAVLFEVTDATGAQHTRSADAVIMSCWPSRGLELHGVEIKVSRYDWMSERRKPAKAETIAAYCDRWWLITGPGVVQDVAEIPPAWGWAELVGGKLVTRKEPERTESKPPTRLFLASLMRNAAKVGAGLIELERKKVREEANAEVEARVKKALEGRASRATELVALVEGFEEATGIQLAKRDTWAPMTTAEGRRIGQMVNAVRASQIDASYPGVQSLYVEALRFAERMEEHAAALGITVEKPKKRGRR